MDGFHNYLNYIKMSTKIALSLPLLILFKTYPKAQLTTIDLESKLAETIALLT